VIPLPTIELSTRAQNALDLLQEVMTDLALELCKDYDQVDVKLSVDAR
jgi:hypothetical protein